MKKLLAFMLVLAFALSFTACGKSDEEKILGNWTLEMDREPLIIYQVVGHNPEPMHLVVSLAFNEDGTVSASYDEELYAAEVDKLANGMQEVLEKAYYEALANAIGAEALDNAMAAAGMTAIQVYESLSGNGDATATIELARSMNNHPRVGFEGTYILNSETATLEVTSTESGEVFTCTYAFTEDGGLELNSENGLPFGADIVAPATFMRAE